MKKNEIKTCKSCSCWKNEQSELEYSKYSGICTSHQLKFDTGKTNAATVFDRANRSTKHMGVHRFENRSNEIPIGDVERSLYLLVTEEDFGCIHHEKKH